MLPYTMSFDVLRIIRWRWFRVTLFPFHLIIFSPSIQNLVGVVGAHMFNLFVVREGLMWLFVEVFEIDDSIAYIPMAIISAVTNFLVIRFVVRKAK